MQFKFYFFFYLGVQLPENKFRQFFGGKFKKCPFWQRFHHDQIFSTACTTTHLLHAQAGDGIKQPVRAPHAIG